MNSIQQAAESTMDFKDKSIAAIASQYGEVYAKAVESVTNALLMASGIIAVSHGNILSKLIVTDLTTKLVSQVVSLTEQVHALSRDQMREVMDLAKELHTKMMDMVP